MTTWTMGVLRARWQMLIAAAGGVALAVCLLAILGVFVTQSTSTMTGRAVGAVAPDWQIQLVGTIDAASALDNLKTVTGNPRSEQVDYADVPGLSATTGGTQQNTGAGEAVGISATYFQTFSSQGRLLAGSFDGAVLAQQTAANLHAGPGDTVTIARLGQPPVEVKIAGVVDMPKADQFFQIVSSTPQTTRNAPPDNVILLPADQWNSLFSSQLETLPETARRQIHASIPHDTLSGDPVQAYVNATGQANNMLAKLAGSGVITNNLAARLDGVRQDALFAKVLFLFLGAPGVAVAILLSSVVVNAGSERQQRTVALLQLRGVKTGRSIGLLLVEPLLIAVAGTATGLVLAELMTSQALGIAPAGAQWPWYVFAAVFGIAATLLVAGVPALAHLRKPALENMGESAKLKPVVPAWQRLWLDVICLVGAGFFFWQSSASGYQVVTAPEGVATATVDYNAYIAPGLLWIGTALLLLRLWQTGLRRAVSAVAEIIRPVAGRFAPMVASSIAHDRARVVKGMVLVTLAFAFAISTAIFNATYSQQAAVDASLTNGADVAITGTIDAPASPLLDAIRKTNGVAKVVPMQHRFAYVGTDLQDLYGIDPNAITSATPMSNAYFQNGDAAASLAALKATSDGILVSDETVSDFQLQPGDTLNLRLRHGGSNAYEIVPFKFVGVVKEFPTAPRDSFLVANSAYVAEKTGIGTAETLLIKSAIAPHELAQSIQSALPKDAIFKVTDVSTTAHAIGSSLTAVDLHGLTQIEIAFALPMVAGALGLVFALGLAERRRSFVILTAIGASRSQLARLMWSEGSVIYAAGLLAGAALGWLMSWVLVKLMTQVFDPPPDVLSVPWTYLIIIAVAGFLALAAAITFEVHRSVPSVPKA